MEINSQFMSSYRQPVTQECKNNKELMNDNVVDTIKLFPSCNYCTLLKIYIF